MSNNRGPVMGAAFAERFGKLNGETPDEDAVRGGQRGIGGASAPSTGGDDPFPISPPAPLDNAFLDMTEKDGALFVVGEVDLYQAPLFRSRAGAYIETADAPRIDITDVAFIDSAGLAALLMLSREAKVNNKALTVIASGAPRRVLRITGIDQAITVEG